MKWKPHIKADRKTSNLSAIEQTNMAPPKYFTDISIHILKTFLIVLIDRRPDYQQRPL